MWRMQRGFYQFKVDARHFLAGRPAPAGGLFKSVVAQVGAGGSLCAVIKLLLRARGNSGAACFPGLIHCMSVHLVLAACRVSTCSAVWLPCVAPGLLAPGCSLVASQRHFHFPCVSATCHPSPSPRFTALPPACLPPGSPAPDVSRACNAECPGGCGGGEERDVDLWPGRRAPKLPQAS
jgi:hypothetical protein